MNLRLLLLIITLSLPACQSRKNKDTTPAQEAMGQDTSTDTSLADTATGYHPPSSIHYIIAPGWGYQLARLFNFDYGDYVQWMQESGVPADHIHLLSYSYLKDLETIDNEIDAQYQEIITKAGPDARFDLLGHSMGGFVGLYTAMRHDYYGRFRRFISLAGIPFGWDNPTCQRGLCGKAHRLLTPFKSPFVIQFHADFANRLNQLETCSLFSPKDAFVRPFDAGRMPNGHNFEIAGMGHLSIIGKKEFFNAMVSKCYDGSLP